MVRPRFANLPREQQQAIVRAARDEFAGRGFHDASLNRVIEAAGISKGSMYYYFDGKEDLYAYIVQTDLEQLFARLGPFPVPDSDSADAFWSTLQDYYLRLMTALTATPDLAALIRGLLAASTTPVLAQAQADLTQAVLPWLEQAVANGQHAGAIRTDVPPDLLITVVMGMGQAMDVWLMNRQPEKNDLPPLISVLIEMMRGAAQP
jgi:AcrR family transcriptional regulator